MRTHRTTVPRCPACRLHLTLCICAQLPRLVTRTRVILLLHQLEANKTTNTGRLALLCLPNSALVMRGRAPDQAPPELPSPPPAADGPPEWLRAAANPVLLFPHPEAAPLARWRDSQEPITLIVPDGTWTQAVRARKRIPGLGEVPCARLPEGLPTNYRLRRAPGPGMLCILEAIAHALAALEDAALGRALLEVLGLASERTLWTRGQLPEDQVRGGIPAAARARIRGG